MTTTTIDVRPPYDARDAAVDLKRETVTGEHRIDFRAALDGMVFAHVQQTSEPLAPWLVSFGEQLPPSPLQDTVRCGNIEQVAGVVAAAYLLALHVEARR